MAGLRRGCLYLTLGCGLLAGVGEVVSQDPPAAGVTCDMGATGGARRYRSGVWGVVEVFADNATDEPAETQSVAWFVDDPTLQFGRRVMVPAHAILRTTCPIRIPELSSPRARAAYFMTEQVIPPPRAGSRQRTAQDAVMASKPLLLDPEVPSVGIIGDFEVVYPPPNDVPYHTSHPEPPSAPDDLVYEMVLAAKRAHKLSRRVSVFDRENLPPEPAVLDVLDVLVLSSDYLASDPGGIAMVRDWVLGGGRLWIMLDQVESNTVAAVLGDSFATAIVDRVRLTHLEMSNLRMDPRQRTVETLDFEQPVDHVRVVPVGVTITGMVNGWPSDFWQPMGAGRVFFTTLSTAAWMRPTRGSDPRPRTDEDQTFFFPRDSLVSFSEECIVKRAASNITTDSLLPYLTQQIGYQIISRSAVAALLGVFCGVLVVAAVWSFRAGRPERLVVDGTLGGSGE